MDVYIVCNGELYEGHSPIAVFATREAAVAMVEGELALDGQPFTPVEGRPGMWESLNGVDQIVLYTMEVQDA